MWQLAHRVKKIVFPSSNAASFSVTAGGVVFSPGWLEQAASITMKTMKGKNFMAQK
jgi:hypothetical protein